MTIGAEELSDLLGAIYACALDPARWEPALARIARRAGRHAAAGGAGAAGDVGLSGTAGLMGQREDHPNG